jgi:succinyl-diaminopimelate desuccinylase
MDTVQINREVVELLMKLISARSINPPGNEIVAAEILMDYFQKHHLPCRLEFVEPSRPNIICELQGASNKSGLLLTSHLDVVGAEDLQNWQTDPFVPTVKEGKIYGRGACDAKGSLAAMAVAMVALSKREKLLSGNVIFAGVMGEEKEGLGSKALIKKNLNCCGVIVGEPTEMQVCIAHKGRMGIRVEITGREAHASQPSEGINAISEMAKLITRLEEYQKVLEQKKDDYAGSPSLAMTTINGGGKRTSVAGRCTLEIDRRFIPGETAQSVQQDFDLLINQFSKETPCKVESQFTPTSQAYKGSINHPLVKAAQLAVEEVSGLKPKVLSFPASCDMYVFGSLAGLATIVMGPGRLEMAHRPNEYISQADISLAVSEYVKIAETFWSM